MRGGIGGCKNQTCGQTDTLQDDGYCPNDYRSASQPAASTGPRS
jgi:hypothetical protein